MADGLNPRYQQARRPFGVLCVCVTSGRIINSSHGMLGKLKDQYFNGYHGSHVNFFSLDQLNVEDLKWIGLFDKCYSGLMEDNNVAYYYP